MRGTCQDTEINRPSKVHSLPRDSKGRGLSRHRKKPTEQVALTSWRQQREGLVKTWKEIDQAWGTHVLETAERGTYQDTDRNRPSKGHSHPGDSRGRDLLGHRKKLTERGVLTAWRRQREGLIRARRKPTERGALTLWRRQREVLVRIRKESD